MKFRFIIETEADDLVERLTNELAVDEVHCSDGVMEFRLLDRRQTAERFVEQRHAPATVVPIRPPVVQAPEPETVEEVDQAEPGPRPDTSSGGDTCPEVIVDLFADDPAMSYSIAAVAAEMPRFKQSTVAFTLAQLVKANRIERRGRGLYGALR